MTYKDCTDINVAKVIKEAFALIFDDNNKMFNYCDIELIVVTVDVKVTKVLIGSRHVSIFSNDDGKLLDAIAALLELKFSISNIDIELFVLKRY